jgi:flavodoxin
MKALVLFDSKFGNTETIAQAVARGIGGGTSAARVGAGGAPELAGVDLLVLGSPVVGGRATKPVQELVARIGAPTGSAPKVAVFDTRMTMKFAQRFGHAAVRMADELKARGFTVVGEPAGFIVLGQKGPLADGEIERAEAWGKGLSKRA